MTDDFLRAVVRRHLGLDRPQRPERDAELPCPSRAFEPGVPAGTCETDGHYLCADCANASAAVIAERDKP